MKKLRSLLITQGIIVTAIFILVVIGFNLYNALVFFPVNTISDESCRANIALQNNKGIYVQHMEVYRLQILG
jgi:Zn-dependent membrane protease YugP